MISGMAERISAAWRARSSMVLRGVVMLAPVLGAENPRVGRMIRECFFDPVSVPAAGNDGLAVRFALRVIGDNDTADDEEPIVDVAALPVAHMGAFEGDALAGAFQGLED